MSWSIAAEQIPVFESKSHSLGWIGTEPSQIGRSSWKPLITIGRCSLPRKPLMNTCVSTWGFSCLRLQCELCRQWTWLITYFAIVLLFHKFAPLSLEWLKYKKSFHCYLLVIPSRSDVTRVIGLSKVVHAMLNGLERFFGADAVVVIVSKVRVHDKVGSVYEALWKQEEEQEPHLVSKLQR